MKRILILAVMMAMVLGFSMQAHATLLNRGTDSLGNRLIYDDDLDITWYDYTKYGSNWQSQMYWASALTVYFGGVIFDDWRLPTSLNQDGSGPCSGYNCTGSEMGHLYYTELGNTAGSGGSKNTGEFKYLIAQSYRSGTSNTNYAWTFNINTGFQYANDKIYYDYAIAVHDGDVAAVPEPGTMLLLGFGLAGLFGLRKRFMI